MIINCPECKKEVPDQAITCPHCGVRIQKEIQIKDTIELALNEKKGLVKVLLARDGKLVLDYENTKAKAVRIRFGLPQKEILLKSAAYYVQRGMKKDLVDWFDSYIRSREREIFEQVQEIRKSIKRLVKIRRCIQIATEAKDTGQSQSGQRMDKKGGVKDENIKKD